MAVKIICNYSKRLGLPGYSSHQFSVSVEAELSPTSDIQGEAARFYHTLQSAVDREIQNTGFVPGDLYGVIEEQPSEPAIKQQSHNGHSSRSQGANPSPSARRIPWKASDKQRDLILKLADTHHLAWESIEALSEEMFAIHDLAQLNKIQASGLIDELLTRYSNKGTRAKAVHARLNGRNPQ